MLWLMLIHWATVEVSRWYSDALILSETIAPLFNTTYQGWMDEKDGKHGKDGKTERDQGVRRSTKFQPFLMPPKCPGSPSRAWLAVDCLVMDATLTLVAWSRHLGNSLYWKDDAQSSAMYRIILVEYRRRMSKNWNFHVRFIHRGKS